MTGSTAAEPQPDLSHGAVVEEVSLVVPETDDPSLPVLTFRAWLLGLASCVFLAFFNTFFSFRTQPMSISTVLMQIIVLPVGKFMAAALPERTYTAFGRWRLSLNPGPFNVKEHVIITVMANGGAVGGGVDVYGMGIVTVMKSYYMLGLTFVVALLISLVVLLGSIPLPLLMSFVWKDQIQLPWWAMLLAFGLASLVTLPGYDVVAQFIAGYLLPGKPIANLVFKVYGRTSVEHALYFLQDLKLGHYMKIPPRSMFAAQLVGSIVSGTVNLLIGWWMLGNIPNICDVSALHPESPWTCPKFRFVFDTSVIWGLIGPQKLFGQHETYRNLIWLFLVGAVLPVPVWAASKVYPEKRWIPLINIPVITYGFAGMPPATPSNIASWIITGMVFNFAVFRYRKDWWSRYNYVLSAALDAGTAFMGVLLFFALQNQGRDLKWWGTDLDHCPLASCPTAPGISVRNCPVFS